jgi:hypothetical protein
VATTTSSSDVPSRALSRLESGGGPLQQHTGRRTSNPQQTDTQNSRRSCRINK